MTMWFRRKKKADPDSALTETLRSLQVLLEDDEESIQKTASKQTNPTTTKPEPRPIQADNNVKLSKQETSTADSPPVADKQMAVNVGESIAPAPSEDVANHELTDNDTTSAENTLTTLEDSMPNGSGSPTCVEDEQHSKEILSAPLDTHSSKQSTEEESSWVDPFRQEDDAPVVEDLVLELDSEDLADQDIEVPGIDTIPILTNVVFEPVTRSTNATKIDTVDRGMLLEVCVNDLKERLRQNNLTQMDGEQEERLRQILTHILSNKNTSNPE